MIRFGETLATAAAELAASPPEAHAHAVHALRLLLKRARAIVRMLRGTLNASTLEAMAKQLRTATRRLATARDGDVGIALLEDLASKIDAPRRNAIQTLRQRYPSIVAKPASPTSTQKQLRQAALALRRWARKLASSPWRKHGWKAIQKGLHRGFRRARRRFQQASTLSREGAFHSWRTSVKALQYPVAFMRPSAPKPLYRLHRELDRLGSVLGTEHDLAVLDQGLVRNASKLGGQSDIEAVRRWLASRRQFHRKEALKIGRRLFARSPSDFVRSLHHSWRRWRHA